MSERKTVAVCVVLSLLFHLFVFMSVSLFPKNIAPVKPFIMEVALVSPEVSRKSEVSHMVKAAHSPQMGIKPAAARILERPRVSVVPETTLPLHMNWATVQQVIDSFTPVSSEAPVRSRAYQSYVDECVARLSLEGNIKNSAPYDGKVVIHVEISADGSLVRAFAETDTGLEPAALDIVKSAAPFPGFPDDLRRETGFVSFTVPLNFVSE